ESLNGQEIRHGQLLWHPPGDEPSGTENIADKSTLGVGTRKQKKTFAAFGGPILIRLAEQGLVARLLVAEDPSLDQRTAVGLH
ncbi:MAG: hypothetical protein EBZ62_07850, partial [Sphingobacteriia bacterium]|nr:hypothetical protein [Sphingobacteriia bacterium]